MNANKIVVYQRQKWTRSQDGWIAGVCEGLGRSFGVEPNLLRVIWVIAIFIFGTGLILYPILAFTLPREDRLNAYSETKILGVCYKIAQRTGVELGLVRLLGVISMLASLGMTLLIYLVLYFTMPPTYRDDYS